MDIIFIFENSTHHNQLLLKALKLNTSPLRGFLQGLVWFLDESNELNVYVDRKFQPIYE